MKPECPTEEVIKPMFFDDEDKTEETADETAETSDDE